MVNSTGSIISHWQLITKMIFNLLLDRTENELLILIPPKPNCYILIVLEKLLSCLSSTWLLVTSSLLRILGINSSVYLNWKYFIESICFLLRWMAHSAILDHTHLKVSCKFVSLIFNSVLNIVAHSGLVHLTSL